jgi:hypothetical protein
LLGESRVPSEARIGYIPAAAADSPVQRTLWANLNLSDCQIEDGTVPVLVHGGDGSADDPWILTTISTDSRNPCVGQTFNLHSEVVRVRILDPDDVVIVYDSGLEETGTVNSTPSGAAPGPTPTPATSGGMTTGPSGQTCRP